MLISSAGLKYTLLDDTHFYYAGLTTRDMFGYYMTEKHGATTAVFPIDKNTRYAIPFHMPDTIIDYFKRLRDEGVTDCVTYGDDGEKFGVWPGTHKWVYEEKWLHNFYSALEANQDVVRTVHFSEFIAANPARGRIYLPMASYEEMMEWSLPVDAGLKFEQVLHQIADLGKKEEWKPFIRGGLWDNFLTKYEESNRMHKKMIYVSGKVRQAAKSKTGSKKVSQARTELYRGQCNCAYWHGLFGGLYLNYLRHAIYHHLTEAEKLADSITRKGSSWVFAKELDYDADGADEVVMENHSLNACFDPDMGGSLLQLDYRPISFCLSNTFTRRREAYHEKILKHTGAATDAGSQPVSIHDLVKLKEPNLKDALIYDQIPRRSFTDRFLPPDTDIETFRTSRFRELGDFASGAFEVESLKVKKTSASLFLSRVGEIGGLPARVVKKFTMNGKDAAVLASYEIVNESEEKIEALFGVEFNMTLLAGDAPDRYWVADKTKGKPRLIETLSRTGVKSVGMTDGWARFTVRISSSDKFSAWMFPVETVSQSEGGFERTYQGSCILIHNAISIPPGGHVIFPIDITVEKLK
jgi:alpha-amylase